MSVDLSKRVGPYVGVTAEKTVTYKNGKHMRFVLYGAYDAYGLIGSEYNGILILDEDRRFVVADNIARESSGYYGPSQNQKDAFAVLTALNWTGFVNLINQCPTSRFRYKGGEWVDNPDVRR